MSDIKCDTSPSDRTQFELFRALFSGFKWRISTSPCWPFGGPNVENFLRLFLQKVYIDHKLNICGRTIWSETCILYHCMICNFVILTCGICVRKGVNEKGVCPSISAFPCHYSANTPCSYCVHSPLVLYTRRIWQRRYTHTLPLSFSVFLFFIIWKPQTWRGCPLRLMRLRWIVNVVNLHKHKMLL